MATKTGSQSTSQQQSSKTRESVWVTPDDKKRDTYVTRTERPATSGQAAKNTIFRF